MRKILTIMLLTLLSINLFAAENKYVIKKINYNIKGSTKPLFLERKLGIKEGIEFNNLEDVENYRAAVEQMLHNLRYFEKLSVETKVSDKNVELTINLDDAWNIIPVPYPKYDSNDGGRIATKLFWNNTLGTLTDTFFQFGVNIDQNVDGNLELRKWDFTTKVSGIYINGRYYDFGFYQKQENESKEDDKWKFISSEFSVGTTFNPHPNFSYSPSVSVKLSYMYDTIYTSKNQKEKQLEADIVEKPLTISYSHGFGKSNVDWIGNFRDGYSYGLNNTLNLIINGNVTPATSFGASGAYYKTFGDLPISLATRVSGDLSINEEILGLGSKIRGVVDGDMYGYKGIYFNNNVYISVIRIDGFAEAIFAPCFDIGYTDNSGLDYGAGADFILYVDKLKSLVARGTIAFDLGKNYNEINSSNFTDYLEIDITSSLTF